MRENALIEAFKTRLQTDPKLLAEFLDAPLGIMRREGVQVSPQAAMQLRDAVRAVAPSEMPAVKRAAEAMRPPTH